MELEKAEEEKKAKAEEMAQQLAQTTRATGRRNRRRNRKMIPIVILLSSQNWKSGSARHRTR